MSHKRFLRKSIKVLITRAYDVTNRTLLFEAVSGRVFGNKQLVNIYLLTLPAKAHQARGLKLELEDAGFPFLKKVRVVTDLQVAFKDIDVVFMASYLPDSYFLRCSNKQLIFNYKMQRIMGLAIKKYAPEKALYLFYGKLSQLNALLCYHFCDKKIPVQQFACATRHIENRLLNFFAAQTGCNPTKIERVTIWGNLSGTYYLDLSHATYINYKRERVPLSDISREDHWVKSQLLEIVNESLSQGSPLSTPMSTGIGLAEQMRAWWQGTSWTTLAVLSDGCYNLPPNIFFCFPVIIKNKNIQINKDLEISPLDCNWNGRAAQELVRILKQLLDICEGSLNSSTPSQEEEKEKRENKTET